MSRVHHLAPWRRQPDVPVSVDWANPLTRGLKFVYVSRRMSDAVSGIKGVPTSAVFRRTVPPVGLGTANGATTDRISFGDLSACNITGAITCLALGAQGLYFGDASAVSKVVSNGGTNSPFDFGTMGSSNLGGGSNGAVRLARANAGGFRVWSGSAQLVVDRAYCIAATQPANIATAPTFYVDGVRDGTSTNRFGGSGSGAATSNAAAVLVQNRGDNTTYWDGGGLALTAVWDRELSEAEIRRVSANPWQLFRPRIVEVFQEVASGGTITLTTSLSAAVQAGRAASAAVAAALQSSRAASASLSAAAQVGRSAAASAQAAVLQGKTSTAAASAAIQARRTATASLTAQLQAGSQQTASLAAAVQQARAASGSVAAVLRASRLASAAASATVQQGKVVTASVSAYLQAGFTAASSLSLAARQGRAATLGATVALQSARTGAAAVSAMLTVAAMRSSLLQAAVQARRAGSAGFGIYIQSAGGEVDETYPLAGQTQGFPLFGRSQTYPLAS